MKMDLEDYILLHSDPEPDYLAEVNRATHLRLINPRMMSGHLQGRVLSMFSKMIQPHNILEIGTFTGYSALCMAESLPKNGELHTIECDDELENFIVENFKKSELGDKIKLYIGDALTIIKNMNQEFDLVFIDADKREYIKYYNLVFDKIKSGGFIIADNTLWDGKVLTQEASNDFQTTGIKEFNSFVAADKRVEKVMLPIRDGLTILRKK